MQGKKFLKKKKKDKIILSVTCRNSDNGGSYWKLVIGLETIQTNDVCYNTYNVLLL